MKVTQKQIGRTLNRRDLIAAGASSLALATRGIADEASTVAESETRKRFKFRFMVASCMYGEESLKSILPELEKVGSTTIDLWPRVHGNQREQVDEMGVPAFIDLMNTHSVSVGAISQYKLGPFGLRKELSIASALNCPMIVTSTKGPRGSKGEALQAAIRSFLKRMQPEFDLAAEAGVRIVIENHGGSLLSTREGIERLLDMADHPAFGFALAPAHLPQDAAAIADLARVAGPRLALFYAWQYGAGFNTKMTAAKERLQLPGRGELSFAPIVKALEEIAFEGFTEVMMHPTPRGTPIASTTAGVTDEIKSSHDYLRGLTS